MASEAYQQQVKDEQEAKHIFDQWKHLKKDTQEHRNCDCAKCSKRRKLGAMIDLPYAGLDRYFPKLVNK